MNCIDREVAEFSSWPTTERIRALKRIIPRSKVKEVLECCGQGKTFCRRLPAWFMVWYVIVLGLFCRESYRQVFRWMQPYRKNGTPGRSTFCEARQRLGLAPFQHLSKEVVQLLGKPDTPGAFYAGMRLMAVDGFVLDLPDTPENERVFGRPGSGRSPGAFPQARVLALCETGSHVLWRWSIKSIHIGENTMAPAVLRFLEADMLLLWDRGFFSYQTLKRVRDRKANLLARIKKSLVFEHLCELPDGSYLTKAYPTQGHRRCGGGGQLNSHKLYFRQQASRAPKPASANSTMVQGSGTAAATPAAAPPIVNVSTLIEVAFKVMLVTFKAPAPIMADSVTAPGVLICNVPAVILVTPW